MRNKIFTSVLALVLILALTIPVFAAGGGSANPQYNNVSSASVSLTFSGSYAMCSAKIVGLSGSSISGAQVYLDRVYSDGSTSRVATWNNPPISGTRLTFSDSRYVISGYTYRLTMEATVTRNGVSEPINLSMDSYH